MPERRGSDRTAEAHVEPEAKTGRTASREDGLALTPADFYVAADDEERIRR